MRENISAPNGGKLPYMEFARNVQYHSDGGTKCGNAVMNSQVDVWAKRP
jgi:hypothetical protein